jgi:carboxypeptidase Q
VNAMQKILVGLVTLIVLPVFVCAQDAVPQPVSASPATQEPLEKIDLGMYQRIMDEGFEHSQVMNYASALTDDIGERLTGSPNMAKADKWTQDQLTAMGCQNVHLESWGEFGMGWQQLNTWARMVSPDVAVFITQATPWSPSTDGPVTGDVVMVDIAGEKDFARYEGKLVGKIVLFGPMRSVPPVEEPLVTRFSPEQLHALDEYPAAEASAATLAERAQARLKHLELIDKIGVFFAEQHVAAVMEPSRDAPGGGGSGGTIFDDNGAALSSQPYLADHKVKIPVVVMAIENYGRMVRLLQARVPVKVQLDVETKVTGDHEQGYDSIAEIPGTDPLLKDQVVMLGAHLDSWISGTGATDNGAGSIVSMEVMRILNSLHVQPRRTIRIALWSGEEEGLDGSRGYVANHFGSFPRSTDPDQMKLPGWLRKPAGPLAIQAEQKLVSAYFNLDNGGGRIRGVYLQQNAAIQPIFAQWIAPLKSLGITELALHNTASTDHVSFDAVGIPGFQFIQDPLDYHTRTHHSNMDVYEELRPDDLMQAAVAEAIFVYNAAMRDQMLPRKPLPNPMAIPSNRELPPDLFPDAVQAAQ